MIPEGTLSKVTLNSDGEDTISTTSSEDECEGVICARNDSQEIPSFGNISVANSSDVHFGNRTFYQGPVTIKQFLYANGKAIEEKPNSEIVLDASVIGDHGVDNPSFIRDLVVAKSNAEIKATSSETNSGIMDGLRRFHKFTRGNVVILVSFLAVLMISLAVLMVVLLLRHSPIPVQSPGSDPTRDEQDKNTPINAPLASAQWSAEKKIVVTSISVVVVVIALLTILSVYLVIKNHNDETTSFFSNFANKTFFFEKLTNSTNDNDPDSSLALPGKLKLVSRLEWVAQPPTEPANPLKTPVPYVIIHHTATENCSSQAQCVFHVRYIQTFHIESRHWWDIGYNFLVGGDGEAYEGRGWKSEGAHTYGYNAQSIGIAFIGTFTNFKPPQRQIITCKRLIAKGVELGYIKKDYKLLAARQLQTTQSPGEQLYQELKTWDHWAAGP